MAPVVTMQQLIDAGVHFGHPTRRWNPKMQRFIHGEQNGIYIIDLRQTLKHIEKAYVYTRDLVADGGTILFIGTKRQSQDSVEGYATKCGMPFVNQRWLGGMLTNFETISKRITKMKEYQRMRDSGEFEVMPKKEALLLGRELNKLERNLGGMRHLEKAPDAVFILDTKKEDIAVTEANKLGIPILAVVDTNCDPDVIQYVIPGNDDAIRAGDLMARIVCDAVTEGRQIRSRRTGTPIVMPRTPEEDAQKAQEQAEARRQAAAQAAQREARMAASRAAGAEEASTTSPASEGETTDVAEPAGE
ncbi:MAG: 30S ribosomal protein S2 [Microthrixaceae bacterium]